MKKTIISFVFGIACISTCMTVIKNNNASVLDGVDLGSIEAIAACEVSSDASLNRGYCQKEYNSNKDVCVTNGSGGETRCNGNL